MVMSNCETPVRVFNQKLKSWIYVPCGKCVFCKGSKSFAWKKRLESEMLVHQFTMQITLTYDNEHLPSITIFPDRTFIYNKLEVNPNTGFLPVDVYDDLSCHYNRLSDGTYFVPVVNHKDIIDFINTLKTQISNVRYYIQSEIGPSTLRPHYHGLIFFDNINPDEVRSYICKAWQMCDWSVHSEYIHLASSASYCTSYVSSSVIYPKLHTYKRFSTFSHKSVSPPIGSLAYSTKDMENFQFRSSIRTALFDSAKSQYVDVPYLRYMSDKYFPRLPRDCEISLFTRKFLYKLYDFTRSFFQVETINYSVFEVIFNRLISQSSQFSYELDKVLTSETSVYRIYLASKAFCKSWQGVNSLLRDYCFEQHFYREEMDKLRQQYLYEEDFCNTRGFSARYLIYKDREFIKDYASNYGFLPLWVESTIKGYGFTSVEDFLSSYWRYSSKYNPLESAYHRNVFNFIKNSHKSNANNSYLAKHGHPAYMHSGL